MSRTARRGPADVVVGVDGSDGSRAALDYAMEEAARQGAPLRALMAYVGPDVWIGAEGLLPDARVLHDVTQRELATVVEEVVAARRAQGAPMPEVAYEGRRSDACDCGHRGSRAFHSVPSHACYRLTVVVAGECWDVRGRGPLLVA